jgi:hypothetical protein
VASAYACVKDTDFDQASDIQATPEIELDLVYFTLTAPQFTLDPDTDRILTVSDTTDFRVLDDSFIRESLKRAEFYFKFENSISNAFSAQIQFLNTNNIVRYEFGIDVASGTILTPAITEHIEVLESPEQIGQVTRASKVVVNVTISEIPQTVEGSLNLQSKGTYFLEY